MTEDQVQKIVEEIEDYTGMMKDAIELTVKKAFEEKDDELLMLKKTYEEKDWTEKQVSIEDIRKEATQKIIEELEKINCHVYECNCMEELKSRLGSEKEDDALSVPKQDRHSSEKPKKDVFM